MLTPEYLLHISEGAEEIAEQLHSDIINRIVDRMMLRIGRGEDYLLTATDKWQIERLQETGALLEDIQKEIAKATKKQVGEIAEAMEDAGVKALDYDDKIYRDAGLSPKALEQSPQLVRLMQRNYEATLGEWNNFTRVTASQAQKLYINQMDKVFNLVATGALSYTEAVKEALDVVLKDGVDVIYPTGHRDSIETATLRAVRTGISQASAQIQSKRMEEMGVELVLVSSHLGARPEHQEWQGKIYSRNGRTDKYPDFKKSTGYGTVSGLCGVNCRHSFSPYFEGMDNPFEQYDSEENTKQYEKEQRQRMLERRIRDTKREAMALKEALDNCDDPALKESIQQAYQRRALLLSNQNAKYKEYCNANELKPLQDRLAIARWDRKQAAAARGAARKQENALNSKKVILGVGTSSTKGKTTKITLGQIETKNTDALVDEFSNQLRALNVENAVLIDKSGNVFQFISESVDSVQLFDVDFDGATILHNHPEENGILSFGQDDFIFLREHQTIKSLKCCNIMYDYSVNVLKDISNLSYNALYLDAMKSFDYPLGEDYQHIVFDMLRKKGYVNYERKRHTGS